MVGKEKELPENRNKKAEDSCSGRLLSFCGICMDKKTNTEMYRSNNCSHSYCQVCISNHVAAKISQNIMKVKCPDLVCNSFLEPQNCRSYIPQQVLDRWEAALCESVLGSKKIYCPFKDCSAPLVDDLGKVVATSAECPHCHRLFCARCRVPWHAGSECKSEDSAHQMDKKFMDLAKREKWQKCPNCAFYVQRTTGCESISCRL
ncbi:E3 ubiquitin ligase RBR family [Trema orientale]|uniref:RBR-type E3 ubiquitin transferase n=1 Tax=Trema orientale TaxID=63057 RepID=A0A2P5DYD9_TREOI|nr:E3 ubiquitin ligase RBR family [Trema orientale]